MISYCGLLCDSCRIHLATLEKDESRQKSMRIEIAKICREQYGMNVVYEDITDCAGCRAPDDSVFSGCRCCDIRACAHIRTLESCARCSDYPCQKLERIFQEDPGARLRLEGFRKNG